MIIILWIIGVLYLICGVALAYVAKDKYSEAPNYGDVGSWSDSIAEVLAFLIIMVAWPLAVVMSLYRATR